MLRLFISQLFILTLLTGCIFDDVNKEPTSQPAELGEFNGNEQIEILVSEILKSVSDPDGDTLTITNIVLAKGLGDLTNSEGTTWIYTPSVADLGEVIFNYTATDGSVETTSTATLNIVNSNRLNVQESSPVHLSMELTHAEQAITTAKITLNILGQDYVISSSNGQATFIGLPVNTEYYAIIEDTNGVLATEYYSNITPVTNETLIQTFPISAMQAGVATQLVVSNITTNQAVTGLLPYINATSIAAENGRLTSLSLPNLMATESEGTYSFLLADNETDYQVSIDELVDNNSVEYSIFGSDSNSYSAIINAGDISNLDLSATNQLTEFTASYSTLNEQNEALSLGGVLSVFNLTKNENENWLLEDGTDNKYNFALTSENIKDKRVVLPIDTESDGFYDFQASIEQDNPLGLLEGLTPSDFSDEKTLNVNLTIVAVETDSSINSVKISKDEDFKAGSSNDILIAFDRPIELTSSVNQTLYSLAQQLTQVDLANPAGIYAQDKTTEKTTDQGEATLNLNNSNAYTYLNDDSNSITVTLGGGADNITSTYVSAFTQNSNSITLNTSNYELLAEGTLLRISPSGSSLQSDTQYSFEFSVNDSLNSNNSASIIYKAFAVSNKAELISDFSVDNFDFKETTKYDPLDVDALPYNTNQTPHEDMYFELDASYDTGTDKALLKYVEYTTNDLPTLQEELTRLAIDTSNNTLYVVTETPITGLVTIKEQTEVYDSSGAKETVTVPLTDASYEYVLTTPDPDASVQQIKGIKMYLFDKPSNHGISNNIVKDTFNVDAAAGANIPQEGIYYIYQLPITPTQSGQVTAVTLEFDISINGSQSSGTAEYQVK